ncbi:hypothetical protein [Curtobacterium flaccumfaciens]|uniref:hypothetical protein n=1 Tax=Curtobacterium flaccumfaciens TaxID=2035 RepID=UPI00105B53AB|nr:hypothetical protein [Curtobacterium flaccumfaciens]
MYQRITPRRPSLRHAFSSLVVAGALAAAVVAAPTPASAATSSTLGTSTLSHTCKWSSPQFVIGATGTIPAGTSYDVWTTNPYYNLFSVRSDNSHFTTQKVSDSQYRVTAVAAVPSGTVATLDVSGYGVPTVGSVTNTIAGDGQRHDVTLSNGTRPC